MGRDLKNKPLVEAILEVKWALAQGTPPARSDPHFKLLLGRFQERVATEFPEYEPLPAARIPDELVGQIVQHRFWRGPGTWPVLQLGPGVLTVNDTAGYTWTSFRGLCIDAVKKLYGSHPKVADLRIESLLLRYIDATAFDPSKEDALAFLQSKLKVEAKLPTNLFGKGSVRATPSGINLHTSFACTKPNGTVTLSFATGLNQNTPSMLWETVVQSGASDVPAMPRDFESWLDSAHDITDDWFFKLIAGDLEAQFS